MKGFLFSRVCNPPFFDEGCFQRKTPVPGDLARFSPRGGTRTESLKTAASPFFERVGLTDRGRVVDKKSRIGEFLEALSKLLT